MNPNPQADALAVAETQPHIENTTLPFSFTGSGSEYFRIWIVNLLLTIVTLGIYSAWAKVRRAKYFYQNTLVDGSSFDYHGNPVAILKGRLIAVGLFVAYQFMVESGNGWLLLAALAFMALALPWMLWKSLQFRARNSSWRGVRFGFGGNTLEAYRTFLMWPLLGAITLYLLWPLSHHQIKAWQHSRARFGRTSFSMQACVGGFYGAYLMALGLLVLAIIGMMVAGIAVGFSGSKEAVAQTLLVAVGVLYLVGLALAPLVMAKLHNTVWSRTALGPHRFSSQIPLGRAAFVGVSNLLGIVLTLGLFMPWAAVRWAQLRASHTQLRAAGSLETFAAGELEQSKAVGEGVADFADLDMGL
jgi:uncharacterized membrane protein YjgN (DUF898 family)